MKTYINETLKKKVGETIELAGWCQTIRKMGKIAFIDLRDSTGLIQVVLVPKEMAIGADITSDLRPEFVVKIKGIIQKRDAKQVNESLATGQIEILAKEIVILSASEVPPFEIDNEERQANDELRLKYRYLDLRHERMNKNMHLRSDVLFFLRNYLQKLGFIEIQTPILSKSTPEGARDYLVPSRLHKGKFFALPQSPQQYKQLLMIAGFERYFQIAPCFRDEDARADRSPGEFYQLDIEMSFVEQEDILQLTEKMYTEMVKTLFPDKKVTVKPWPRLSHADAMKKYGTDKPDLRQEKNDPNELAFAWIVDFPLFTEQSADDKFYGVSGKFVPSHHMFTAPHPEDVLLLDKEPLKVRGLQHDLVLNGYEVGGGSIRIHDAKIQQKVWDLIGFTAQQQKMFSHLIEAFKYGVPPHGGIAPGIERLLMVLAGEKNLREITAFPLTSDGRDPLMDSPSQVTKEQLAELGLRLEKKS
ncbi:MAG: aspartate--tRNA ligase [Candidatus Komeilibacteria bacterium]